MAKVMIYPFQVYDIQRDVIVKSKRWGTKEAVREVVYGQVLEDTGVEVDESVVLSDIHGFTAIGFDPRFRSGFQTSVSR